MLESCLFWIFLWVASDNVSANYVLSNESFTWQDARGKGNLAAPKIHVNNSSIIVEEVSNLNENEEAWVGYYMKETAFAYIGCGSLNNTEPDVLLPVMMNSPGICFSMCHKSYTKYVGLNKGKCICLNEKPSKNINLPKCDISPNNGTWVAGGGDDYMSIYERMKTDTSVIGSKNNGKCLAYEKNTKGVWSMCSTAYKVLCTKDPNISNVVFEDVKYLGWNIYVQTCFDFQRFPITYNDTLSVEVNQITGELWTNIIRSDVIFKYDNTFKSQIQRSNFKGYGYVTKHGNITTLSFTLNSTKKPYFLQTRSSTYTTSPLTSTIADRTLTSSINNEFINITKGFQSNDEMSAFESSNVSILVSVSVVILLLVAAIVIVIIILKRRGKIPDTCFKSSSRNDLFKEASGKNQAENNLCNQSVGAENEQIHDFKGNNNVFLHQDLDVDNSNYAHNYFILEPGSREYLANGDISNSRRDGRGVNDDYNMIHFNKKFGTQFDNVYDTTENAAIKIKALKNTECVKELSETLKETDKYNHITRNFMNNDKTDNIYGVSDTQENDYDDVKRDYKNNLRVEVDIYNHLNGTY